MKIAVLGYSGAGKSTLARALGEHYGIPVLHFDTVQFTPNWEERDRAEARALFVPGAHGNATFISGEKHVLTWRTAAVRRWTLSSSGGCCGRAAPGGDGKNFKRSWRNIPRKQSF